jgi:hypothetical protein
MAQIKKIVRSNPISNFQRGAPEGGGAFRLLAEGLNDLYDRVAPVAAEQMAARGTEEGRAAAKAQLGGNRPFAPTYDAAGRPDLGGAPAAPMTEAQKIGRDAMQAIGKGDGWLKYQNQSAVRNKPISDDLKQAMSFLPEMGITMQVISGGQDAKGEGDRRTGSTRHDHGKSADVDFYKDGRKLVSGNPEDEAVLAQIVARARQNGVTGFGEGADYMGAGRVHLGYGAPAVWGAGGKGENAPQWLRNAAAGASSPVVSTKSAATPAEAPAPAVSPQPPVMIRKSDGTLEARMYSPYSGPILQAYNAAAKVAYQAEVLNKGAVDLMDMSSQFVLDPEGFQSAATGYIDQLIEAAPTDFQGELRGVLEKEVQRRAFGMMEEKQRDIRQRASNSSAALVDRWSSNLTDAIVSGDRQEIEAAQRQLDGLLQAREALPGVSWTMQQSANVIIEARKRAAQVQNTRRTEQSKQNKSDLELIIKAAKAGAYAANEGMLDDPAVIAENPELAREAAAHIALRDSLPEFQQQTPAAQAAAAAALAAQPVQEEWQLDIADAAGKIAADSRKAWEDDPVKQAQTVMKDNPPPAIPPLTPEDPDAFVQGLTARREYMNDLREQGYIDTPAFLSNEEADNLKLVMGVETPPELRAAAAQAIVAGFGPDAVAVFDEIDADPVTMYAGKMLAVGKTQGHDLSALGATMLRGQMMMQEGLVRVPGDGAKIDAFNATVATAFEGVPGGFDAQGEIMEAARALYAAEPSARTLEPTSDAAKDIMGKMVQKALGQSERRGKLTGGVQTILGGDTLLPIGVSGEEVERAVKSAFGVMPPSLIGRLMTGPGSLGQAISDNIWSAVGGAPLHNGKPIPMDYAAKDKLRLVPSGGNLYRIEIMAGADPIPAQDAEGNVFFFDVQKLLEAAR